jgi:hypothetical protein
MDLATGRARRVREYRSLDADRLDLNGIDLAGLSREDVLAALTDAAIEAYEDAAEFGYDPSEPRDRAGKWTAGGGGGGSKAERSAARVERKRAEKAVERQRVGRLAHLEGLLIDHNSEILEEAGRAAAGLPAADRLALRAARLDATLITEGGRRPLAERLPAYERLSAEADRLAPRATPDGREALGRIRRLADKAAALIRAELASRRAAVFSAAMEAAEFYSPDQARDWRGRWTSGGGEGGAAGGQRVPTHQERADLRQASMQAVRAYVSAGGEPSRVENEQLAAHLARLTVDQLHAVKAEHGLKASAARKADLVSKLAERFRAHRATQEPAGAKALKEAVAGKPGFHNVREVVGGHAVRHGPTGSQVRADHAGTRFDVLTSGSTLHSSHAAAAAAVKAAEASNRFGTGQSTAEEESRARHEAITNAQKRVAAEPVREHVRPSTVDTPSQGALNSARQQKQAALQRVRDLRERIKNEPLGGARASLRLQLIKAESAHAAAVLAERQASQAVEARANELGQTTTRPPAAAPPAPAAREKVGGVPLYRRDEAKALPNADQLLRDAAAAQPQIAARAHGVVKVADLYDALKAKHPSLSLEDFHRQILQWQKEDRITVGAVNDPRLESADALAKAFRVPDSRGFARVHGYVMSIRNVPPEKKRRPAGFSVYGALSPEEAEERAALRLAERYAEWLNARPRRAQGVRA